MDRPRGRALLGPAVIVLGVVWALRDFVVRGLSTSADIVTAWLPLLSDLGRNLRAGRFPGWTPHVLGGMPLAADVHSGWLQPVPMVLYTALPADLATAWLVAVNPILAGLGAYWFLRSEGLSRPAATLGGLALALPLAITRMAVSVRFPSAIAWTAIAMACASRAVHAEAGSRRTWWALAAALAWGQIALSHLTVGLAVGTLAIAAYLLSAWIARTGDGRRRVARLAGGLAAAALAVNLALLLPRVAFASSTSLAHGYEHLDEVQRELTGRPGPPLPGVVSGGAAWGLNLAVVPGGPYLGGAVLGLGAFAWTSRRRRALVAALSGLGTVCYVLSIGAVAGALEAVAGWLPGLSQYLHGPGWLSMGVLLSLALLAAIGLEAAAERSRPGWTPIAVGSAGLGAGLAAGAGWGAVPVAAGAAGLWVLLQWGGRWRRAAAGALVAVEILAPVAWLEAVRPYGERMPVVAAHPRILLPMRDPGLRLSALLRPGPIARALDGRPDRFVTLGPADGAFVGDPAALQYNEAQTLGLHTAAAYRSVIPERLFTAVRVFHREPIPYNVVTVHDPHPVWLDLLHVGWIVSEDPPGVEASAVATESRWTLYRLAGLPPEASVIGAWEVVPDAEAALRRAAAPGFDPSATVVLESEPGIASGRPGPAGTAVVTDRGPASLELSVEAGRAAVVLVRTPWDRGWRARVDGRPAEVLPADGFVQAVPVAAGSHRVELWFDDPWQRWGLAGSALAVSMVVGWAVRLGRRERAAVSPAGGGPPTSTRTASRGP